MDFWKKIRQSPLILDSLRTTGWSILGKSTGFLIPFFIAAWFGADPETDAFFFAYGLVLFATGIFVPVVESVVVPFIAEIRAKDEAQMKPFLAGILVLCTVGLTLLGGILLLISKPVLGLVTGFDKQSIDIVFYLLAETIPLLVLLVCSGLVSGTLNAYRVFGLPAISPAFRAAITLFVIFILKDSIGIHSIPIGYVIGELVRLSFLVSGLVRMRIFPFKISFGLIPKFFEFLRTSSYQVVSMVAVAFNPIVDKAMASWLGEGSVSILEYADRLYQIPTTLMGYGLLVVLLSHWSDDFYRGGQAVFKRKVIKTASIVGAAAFLFSIVLILTRYPLANLVYGYGKFPPAHLEPVIIVWGLYLIGLGPTIVGFVFARAHLVRKNTRVLMNLGICNCIMKIVLNLLLIGPLGIYGLALSTTLTYSLVSVGLFLAFLRGGQS